MVLPPQLDSFMRAWSASGLLPEDHLCAYVAFLNARSALPSEPAEFAARAVADGVMTEFQAEQLLAGKYRGFALGKYQILERIGKGGMGAVYLAVHKAMNRRVAVKVLAGKQAAEPGVVERFYREVRAAAALDHPNIAHAHDADRHGEVHFLVMEFVDGIDFHDLVAKRGPLPPDHAAHYIRQAALGLEHAHERKLVHRDIKPGNLMVNRQGVVKILDMGLARFFQDGQDNLTRDLNDGSVFGTLDYISPEQALDSHEVDIRSDLYSLGATLYFLLAGQPPFSGGTTAQKLMAHQLREPEGIRKLRPQVPEGLAAVVAKMLAKQPDDRYQTPAAVAEALAPWAVKNAPPPSATELPPLCKAAAAGGGSVPEAALAFAGHRPSAPVTQRPRRVVQPEPAATIPRPSLSRSGVSASPSTISPRTRTAERFEFPAARRRLRGSSKRTSWVLPTIAMATGMLGVGFFGWLFLSGPAQPEKKEIVLEGEILRVARKSGDFPVVRQNMTDFKGSTWSGNSQLWASPTKIGDWTDINLNIPADGKYRLFVKLTRAQDYGVIQFSLAGNNLGEQFDGFIANTVVNSQPIDLGVAELKKGVAPLRIAVMGTNRYSKGARYMWGLDCVILRPQ